MNFAKLFESEKGQILVMLKTNDEGCPEVRVYAQPENLGLCSVAFGFKEGEEGEQAAKEGFEKMDAEMAIKAANDIFELAADF